MPHHLHIFKRKINKIQQIDNVDGRATQYMAEERSYTCYYLTGTITSSTVQLQTLEGDVNYEWLASKPEIYSDFVESGLIIANLKSTSEAKA